MTDSEARMIAFKRTQGKCAACGKKLLSPQKFAYRVRPTKNNIRKYGEAVLRHPLNLCAWCGDKKCAEQISIEQSPLAIRDMILMIVSSVRGGGVLKDPKVPL